MDVAEVEVESVESGSRSVVFEVVGESGTVVLSKIGSTGVGSTGVGSTGSTDGVGLTGSTDGVGSTGVGSTGVGSGGGDGGACTY